jgi:hypothetical protein
MAISKVRVIHLRHDPGRKEYMMIPIRVS